MKRTIKSAEPAAEGGQEWTPKRKAYMRGLVDGLHTELPNCRSIVDYHPEAAEELYRAYQAEGSKES